MSVRPRGYLHRDALPHRIANFFASNPDEDLTFDDAKVKFDADPDELDRALCRLRALGIVETPKVIRRAR